MTRDKTIAAECRVFEDGSLSAASRELICEEPLRILVNGESVATLMRTPGGEEELALGYMLTEGIIGVADEVGAISFCSDPGAGATNEVRVQLVSSSKPSGLSERYREVFSSCSVCGEDMLEAYGRDLRPFDLGRSRFRPSDVFRLARAMEAEQSVFRRTGGAHAAALSETPISPGASCLVREDIGRHNALDKVVGAAARRGISLERAMLLLSGRLSFEMVVKAARAGIGAVTGVSAPSALGVAFAARLGMFLAGFARGDTMTVYTGHEALSEG